MDLKSRIETLLEPLLEDGKYFVVDVSVTLSKIRNKIVILLDSDEGITIDECGSISRKLGVALEEVVEEAFTFEVSSPGLDTPLGSVRQFKKNIGRSLKVVKNDGTIEKGKLTEITEEGFTVVEEKPKNKNTPAQSFQFLYNEIKQATILVSFK